MDIMKRKLTILGVAFTLIASVMLGGCFNRGPNIVATNLMRGISSNNLAAEPFTSNFVSAKAIFSVELFRQALQAEKNTLISATSVMNALAMAANGADGDTLREMEHALAGMPLSRLNRHLHSFNNSLFSDIRSQLEIANSIWFRENGFNVNHDFLQTNADYFGADAFAAPFNNRTITDINNWIRYHTAGMIDSIIDDIGDDMVMYLINAVMFDAEWAQIYFEHQISQQPFFAFDGKQQNARMMRSTETIFIEDGLATGFIKPYHGGHYSFVALLPKEGVCIMDYVQSMSGAGFLNTIKNARELRVQAALPQFEFEFDLSLVDALEGMGMRNAFIGDIADFTGIGTAHAPIFISEVEHATFISVDTRGTRAGAVTSVGMQATSAPQFDRTVILDRPFVFAIIDNASSLPIFMGTVLGV